MTGQKITIGKISFFTNSILVLHSIYTLLTCIQILAWRLRYCGGLRTFV